MARASISYESCTSGEESVKIKFKFKIKDGYKTNQSDGIRLYYSTDGTCPTKDNNYVSIALTDENTEYVPGDGTYVRYIFYKPVPNVSEYNIQLRMKISNSDGSYQSKYASYKAPSGGTIIKFVAPTINQPLFMIPIYAKTTDPDEEDKIWTISEWKDYTSKIELPSYDVNYEDITEDWEDANYYTHRIIPRRKVVGKFNLWFSNLEEYNTFMYLIQKSKERNGNGRAYVELNVQINDDINEDSYNGTDISTAKCTLLHGYFFLKIDSNPWNAPVFGHYDKYQAIGISIQEA